MKKYYKLISSSTMRNYYKNNNIQLSIDEMLYLLHNSENISIEEKNSILQELLNNSENKMEITTMIERNKKVMDDFTKEDESIYELNEIVDFDSARCREKIGYFKTLNELLDHLDYLDSQKYVITKLWFCDVETDYNKLEMYILKTNEKVIYTYYDYFKKDNKDLKMINVTTKNNVFKVGDVIKNNLTNFRTYQNVGVVSKVTDKCLEVIYLDERRNIYCSYLKNLFDYEIVKDYNLYDCLIDVLVNYVKEDINLEKLLSFCKK